MPKDYQEVERIVEEAFKCFHKSKMGWHLVTPEMLEKQPTLDDFIETAKSICLSTLTTYGNAKHHEGFQLGWKDGHAEAVEEIIKISEGMTKKSLDSVYTLAESITQETRKSHNQALTDLIQAIKK
jgi:flagellar biosynthesis/type III secretory pathway protein FliH